VVNTHASEATRAQRHGSPRTARPAELDTLPVSTPTGHAPQPARRDADALVAPVAELEIRRGPDVGQRFVLATDTVTVLGREPSCDVVLSHVTVSARHAEIRPSQHGFMVVDTGALNGTYLNRRPVDTAPLAHGDHLQVGVFRLTVHNAGDEITTAAGLW
jgi:pSer/pThr/pTyr-binding forkhead associated (FHA) protein